MDISRVKYCLGKRVKVFEPQHCLNGVDFILTGCTIRKSADGKFFYQAEVKDLKAKSSVIICRLDDIEEIRSPKEIKKT